MWYGNQKGNFEALLRRILTNRNSYKENQEKIGEMETKNELYMINLNKRQKVNTMII